VSGGGREGGGKKGGRSGCEGGKEGEGRGCGVGGEGGGRVGGEVIREKEEWGGCRRKRDGLSGMRGHDLRWQIGKVASRGGRAAGHRGVS